MRKMTLIAASIALAAGPALAQSSGGQHSTGSAHRGGGGGTQARNVPRTGQAPNDRGPFTPEANQAYQGGGVILEGAPGAPAPMPAPTPPGQMPRNAVPMR